MSDEVDIPRRIGQYEVIAQIGVGGMGRVYRARDTRLNRPVAIKFLSPDLADESGRRRFQQEARAVSALNHPHILTVHDAGELDGQQYLVTEFVDGGTLGDWALEKRSWRQIVELLIGVADGLAELVADSYSTLSGDFDAAAGVMKELLFTNPAAVHSIPIE